jgi:hypothetical protein
MTQPAFFHAPFFHALTLVITRRLLKWLPYFAFGMALLMVIIVLLFLFFASSFVSFSIHNSDQQPIDIIDISASSGLIFGSKNTIQNNGNIFMSGIIINNSSIEIIAKIDGTQRKLVCENFSRKDNYFEIIIAADFISCE